MRETRQGTDATVALAGVRDEPIPVIITGYTFDGSTLTVHLQNTSSEPAQAMLTVEVVSNGVVVETHTRSVSMSKDESDAESVPIMDDIKPLDHFRFGLD